MGSKERNDPRDDSVNVGKHSRKKCKKYLKYALSALFGLFLGLFAGQLPLKAALFFCGGGLCLAVRLLLED